jgi:glycosyltransferase involved in cell wall biosynthesis
MPQNAFIRPASENRPRWGYGKKQLDICFMAHRYTQHGEDKGYDVFINVASRLSKLHADIHYHVVGPYDRHVLNVNHINEKITFYGTVSQDKLDDLFRCMDIVISPNISGKIYNGSFDGFPTASCTEGGLRGVAIFCTDEFNLSPGFFTDKHDIVLLKYDLDEIVDKLSWYYHHPESLREIGENGKETIKKLYSCDAQITPRVNVLRKLIETPFVFDVKKSEILPPCVINARENPLNSVSASKASAFWHLMRTYTPPAIKSIYRKHIKKKYN